MLISGVLSHSRLSYMLLPSMTFFVFGSSPANFSADANPVHSIKYYYDGHVVANESSDNGNMSSYLRNGNTNVLRSVNHHVQWLISNGKDVVGDTDVHGQGLANTDNYTPYGRNVRNSRELTSSHLPLTIETNPFRYGNYYYDSESGLYYLNSRYYSPELMRFINRDTCDLANRYSYCDDDPIGNIDPDGTNAWSWIDEHLIPDGTAGWVGFGVALALGAGTGALLYDSTVGSELIAEMAGGATGNAGGDATEEELKHVHLNWNIAMQAGVGAVAGLVLGSMGSRSAEWISERERVRVKAMDYIRPDNSKFIDQYAKQFAMTTKRILNGDELTDVDRRVAGSFLDWHTSLKDKTINDVNLARAAQGKGVQECVGADEFTETQHKCLSGNRHFKSIWSRFSAISSIDEKFDLVDACTETLHGLGIWSEENDEYTYAMEYMRQIYSIFTASS